MSQLCTPWNTESFTNWSPSHSSNVDLLKSERGRPAAVLVPESVAQSVVVELLPDDAGQGGANLGKAFSF